MDREAYEEMLGALQKLEKEHEEEKERAKKFNPWKYGLIPKGYE
jgi:hypothetical protein